MRMFALAAVIKELAGPCIPQALSYLHTQVPACSRSAVRPYPGRGRRMAKGQMRGNRELKKPKLVKAPLATADALSGKAVLERIAVPKKKT